MDLNGSESGGADGSCPAKDTAHCISSSLRDCFARRTSQLLRSSGTCILQRGPKRDPMGLQASNMIRKKS